MKKVISFFVFSLLLFNISCDNDIKTGHEQYSYFIDDIPLENSFNFSYNVSKETTTFTVVETKYDDYNQVLNYLNTLVEGQNLNFPISSIVFYSNIDDNSNSYNLESTIAVSIFYLNNGKLFHSLFKKNNNSDFIKDINFDKISTANIELNTLQNLSLLIEAKSWHFIKLNNFKFYKTNASNTIGEYIETELLKKREIYKIKNPSGLTCWDNISFCYSANECPCSMSPDGGLDCAVYGCGPTDCGISEANKLLSNENKLNTNFAYNFRNNFLKKYNKGKLYISYYYVLSKELKSIDYFTLSNILYDYNFYKKIYSIANTLENGNNDDIVISSSDSLIILNKINVLKNYAPNNEKYQIILNNIKNDVITYTNKTRVEIISIL